MRATDRVTTFPAGVNAAATWQRKLMRQRGEAIGAEFKGTLKTKYRDCQLTGLQKKGKE